MHQSSITMLPIEETKKTYGDLTGRFPYTSSRGNQYFLVIYNYDSNAILVELLKSRSGTELSSAYNCACDWSSRSGCPPKFFMLDNKIPTDLSNVFDQKNIKHQLVPPENYRRNAAERVIQTWKNHFIAGLSSVDPTFPMSEWYRLVQQGELTLNLLRNARVNPKLSAWTYLFGKLNYNDTPLAPPGTKFNVACENTQERIVGSTQSDCILHGTSNAPLQMLYCIFPKDKNRTNNRHCYVSTNEYSCTYNWHANTDTTSSPRYTQNAATSQEKSSHTTD